MEAALQALCSRDFGNGTGGWVVFEVAAKLGAQQLWMLCSAMLWSALLWSASRFRRRQELGVRLLRPLRRFGRRRAVMYWQYPCCGAEIGRGCEPGVCECEGTKSMRVSG